MDMMYMPDAIDAIIKLMNADPDRLVHRNAFNISAMSFDPEEIKASIQKSYQILKWIMMWILYVSQ